ncbi:STY0301 family protein [uncultured Gilliamella sp.]|uniref:STY0301 family protein n=1 Tax=uncultured Gilliamella sp. TaxID=1193505 RepID=UPI0025DABA59|nr:STY0301 family protein [uncultured Gilliamella sp.]
MFNKIRLLLVYFLLLATPLCYAQKKTILCPLSINVQGIQNISVTPLDDFSLLLSDNIPIYTNGIALYSGHPNQKSELKPYNEDDNPPTWKWLDSNKETVFISCIYANGLIRLNKAIENVKTCTAYQTNSEAKLICQ